MNAILRIIRATLDKVYLICGALAALSVVLILALIAVEMVTRWAGVSVRGTGDYAGYAIASASFLALAYTFNHGDHIRVELLLSRLGPNRRLGEIWSLAVAALLALYFAYYAIKMTYWSYLLHDVSQGQDATPLWIPQLTMSIGVTVFAIALVDQLIRRLFGRLPQSGDRSVENNHLER